MNPATRRTRDVAGGEFERARAQAKSFENIQRDKASRTVAGHSIDAEDCSSLLAMLGLHDAVRQYGEPAQVVTPAAEPAPSFLGGTTLRTDLLPSARRLP
ncbi:hypothetical protein CFN78_25765 [Amycolatopsis antarctica]|uniref:Uncharacterized protein n=1 Tax=Amycolatopsis antarctica TaxID=1854586 RepID=A0A263CW22_9PSEU|nr:hypothetical protein [Amycolatopsis antarctica]OZM70332.1 hypothetical protein CFN78_25765 [Amycolatopsis antarctica]